MEHFLEKITGWAKHGVDKRGGWSKKLKALEESERKQVNRADRLARKAIREERRGWTKEQWKEHRDRKEAVWAERGGERPKRHKKARKGKKARKEEAASNKKKRRPRKRARKARTPMGLPRRAEVPQDKWDAMSPEEKKAHRKMHGSLYETRGETEQASNDTFDSADDVVPSAHRRRDDDDEHSLERRVAVQNLTNRLEDREEEYDRQYVHDYKQAAKHLVSSEHAHKKMHEHHTREFGSMHRKVRLGPPAAAAASRYLGERIAPGTKW